MVGQSENIPVSGASTTTVTDRGVRETFTTTAPRAFVELPRYHYFWGSVVGGSMVNFAIWVLSYAMMFGFGIGVDPHNGGIYPTWGAAIWVIVTSAIAYYFGGFVAGQIGEYYTDRTWLRGLCVWGLSVPLFLVWFAFIAAGLGLAYGLNTSQLMTGNTYVPAVFRLGAGPAWTMFFSLLVGLVFSVMGGMAGSRCEMKVTRS
jgi:hypothetical protein